MTDPRMMMPMMQEVTTNYRTAGLSLKTDPLALIRGCYA
jgi:hypothetical protein